jgi:ATP-dependent helicase/nuclease subunit B
LGFSLYTIASENPFLEVLARAVMQGFPVGAKDVPLSRWTILVPNRRSARALSQTFLRLSGKRALLLPRIKPIGDIDEDILADGLPEEGVEDAISPLSHLHALLDLVLQWAKRNPQSELAQDVLQSGSQAFALAQSLQQLVNQLETEDADPSALKGVYTLDLAGHRENILDLLALVTRDLPALLQSKNLIGPSARRNLLIRLEAQRITKREHKDPIIAAGSTGTNPATRDLLKAIALDPLGAVVLPGVDRAMDDEAWKAITAEHPQFALHTMLREWGVARGDVQELGQPQGQRMWLLREALVPAAVSDQWAERLKGKAQSVIDPLAPLEMVEAATREEEADVIALRLCRHFKIGEGNAALITPDRDLATRVKAILAGWDISIDDSAGEPLLHQGRAALVHLLLRAVAEEFAAPQLFALLYHEDCSFGSPRDEHLRRVRALELTAFRGVPGKPGLQHLPRLIANRKVTLAKDTHFHPLVKALTPDDWTSAETLAATLDALLTPLLDSVDRGFAEHLNRLQGVLDALAPPNEKLSQADDAFETVFAALKESSQWHPVTSLAKAQHAILHALSRETLRAPLQGESKLSIYGLAEARLVDVSLAVLGGLVEGVWPAHPDTGPWVNRPMRTEIKLQQPEREIGVTAHDFAQAMGHQQVMITWPRKLKGAPATPSRWVLRLQAMMEATGLKPKDFLRDDLQKLSAKLREKGTLTPIRRPQVTPPVSKRPTQFSVTRVEKLVRDSYWIYANRILNLKPLDDVGRDMDAALRGTIIHEAIQQWTKTFAQVPAGDRLQLLLAKGEEAFGPYMDLPEVSRFWWPRFKRMAEEFVPLDEAMRSDVIGTRTEVSGKMSFDAANVEHTLTAQADRIDILDNAALRIIDYKSGQLPTMKQVTTGFAPQLTLEGAIAQHKGFQTIEGTKLDDVLYIGVGGGRNGVDIRKLSDSSNVEDESRKAFAKLAALLAAFQSETTPYIPLHNVEKEEDGSDYDHLSRRLEWLMNGTSNER